MMDVYVVVMRVSGKTWIDSLWVKQESADERVDALKERLISAEIKALVGCWMARLKLEDANLSEDSK